METNVLKYGIGILTPVRPAGVELDVAADAGTIVESKDAQVRVLRFEEASEETKAAALAHLAAFGEEKRDPVFTAHDRAVRDVTVVVIPKGRAAEPVHVTHPSVNGTSHSRVVIIAEEGSSVRVVESGSPRVISGHPGFCRVASIELVLAAGARVDYVALETLDATATDFIRRRAALAKDASLELRAYAFGAGFSRVSDVVRLEGEGASFLARTASFGAGRQSLDAYQEVLHLAPRTTSDLMSRGVLKDKAKSIVRGLVRIAQEAVGSVGRQKEETLLLSDGAEADTVPLLEIATDDVKCGHAASIGRVDEEKLFYLMSRGISRRDAVAAVVEGFLTPMIVETNDILMEDALRAVVLERLKDL